MKAKSALLMAMLLLCLSFSNLFAQEPGQPPQRPDHGAPNGQLPEGIRQNPQMPPNMEQSRPNDDMAPKGRPQLPIPGLSKEQNEKIEHLNLEAEKKILPLRAEIKQKEAQLEALAITDAPALKDMDALIDAISGLQAKIAKIHNATRLDIRKLLNDDQRTAFDSMPPHHPGGPGRM
jgi:hypothetical protein